MDKLWSRNFILIGIANLLMAVAFYFLLPTLPVFLKEELGASSGQIGMVLAFYTIAALLIRPFVGYAIDAFGRKTLYLLSFVLFSSMFFGYIWAISIGFMIALRFLHGLTWGSLTTSGSTIAVDLIPVSRRGEGISLFGLSMTIAMAIGPMIALTILGDGNYKELFTTAIGISTCGMILAFCIRFPEYKPHSSNRNFSIRKLIEPTSLPISLNMLIITFTYGGLLSFSALYGKEIGVENSGPFFLILSAGIGISRFFSGSIFDKAGPFRITIIGLIILSLGFPILAFLRNSLGFHLSAMLIGFGFGIIMPTFQAMINNLVPPERRGAANSTFFTSFDLGIGLGMVSVGLISGKIGYSGAFFFCSLFEFLAIAVFIFYSYKHYKNRIIQKPNH
ncbi:MAG: MFS transporter [Tenuifilaceae bacterium]